MEDTFDIPHATTPDFIIENGKYGYIEYLKEKAFSMFGIPIAHLGLLNKFRSAAEMPTIPTNHFGSEILKATFICETDKMIKRWGTQLWLDTLDTRPWWAVRLY